MTAADPDLSPHLPLVQNLNRLPEGQDDKFWFHPDEPGFALRVRRKANGKITNNWYHQRRHAGRKELGDARIVKEADAIKVARQINARVELGQDVQGERAEKRAADRASLKQLFEAYVAYKAKTLKPNSLAALRHYLLGKDEPGKCRNFRAKTGMIKSYFAPWHSKPAYLFTKAHASEAIAKCEEASGAPSAKALKSAGSAAMSWGIREGRFHVEQNVFMHAREVEHHGKAGRVFTDAELKLIWDHAPEGHARAVVRMLISTACRRSEVGGMCWSELDLDAGRWAIPLPRLKNARTRAKFGFGAHTLKVTPVMRSIIDEVHPRAGRDQLFGSRGNGFTSWSECKERLDEVIAGQFSFHDIRRSVASRLGDLEVAPYLIEMLLGHIEGGIVSTYNRSAYQKQLDAVIELWHGHLAEVVGWKVEESVAA